MVKQKLLHNSLEGRIAYGAFLDDQGTKVELDEEAGLLEAERMFVEGNYQRNFVSQASIDATTAFGRKRTARNKGEKASITGSDATLNDGSGSSVCSKTGSYNLLGHRRSGSESSTGSGSSDELFTRSSTTSGSSHSCHEGIPRYSRGTERLLWKFCSVAGLGLTFAGVEFAAGYYSSSVSVICDAGKLLGDFWGFAVTLLLVFLARNSPNSVLKFGYFRAEVFGLLVSLLVGWFVTAPSIYEAILRLAMNKSYDLNVNLLVIISTVGFLVTILVAIILHGCGCLGNTSGSETSEYGAEKNSTVCSPFLHAGKNVLMSTGLLTTALVIEFYPDYKMADSILALIFGLLMVVSTVAVLRDVAHILTWTCPSNVSFEHILDDLEGLPGVRTVHDLHLWTLTPDQNALAGHISTDPSFSNESILTAAQKLLKENYFLFHSTIQVEPYHQDMESCKECIMPGNSK